MDLDELQTTFFDYHLDTCRFSIQTAETNKAHYRTAILENKYVHITSDVRKHFFSRSGDAVAPRLPRKVLESPPLEDRVAVIPRDVQVEL